MFWRKKTDGFEWHKYVRTTIKIRREDRKRRIDGVKDAAVAGIKDAGRAGLEGGAAGLDRINGAFAAPFIGISRGIGALLTGFTRLAERPLRPVADLMASKGVAPMLGLVAAVSGLLGLGRLSVQDVDLVTMIELGIGLLGFAALIVPALVTRRGVSLFAELPARIEAIGDRIPGLSRLSRPVMRAVTGGAIGVLVVGVGLIGARAIGQFPLVGLGSFPGLTSLTSRPAIEGRAAALAGDVLRVNSRVVKLRGIEAPEHDQQCGGQGRERRWKCGAAAQTALQDMVRSKSIRCDVASTPEAETAEVEGSCSIDGKDVAADLVARGHVFAAAGIFSGYGRFEQDARNAKLGVWRGAAERPAEYRARLWELARKTAPDGCPIKGRVSAGAKLYVAPWSPGYRDVKVQAERGGRWFCSEQEAQAAGWKLGTRS